jgi:hypothetical protein
VAALTRSSSQTSTELQKGQTALVAKRLGTTEPPHCGHFRTRIGIEDLGK